MPRLQACPIVVSERERVQLEALVRRQSCPQHLALRARIILAAADGEEVRSSMRRLGVARSTVQQGRRRWTQRRGRVVERLADAPRPGTPPTFGAEEI
jgi:putative transposase